MAVCCFRKLFIWSTQAQASLTADFAWDHSYANEDFERDDTESQSVPTIRCRSLGPMLKSSEVALEAPSCYLVNTFHSLLIVITEAGSRGEN